MGLKPKAFQTQTAKACAAAAVAGKYVARSDSTPPVLPTRNATPANGRIRQWTGRRLIPAKPIRDPSREALMAEVADAREDQHDAVFVRCRDDFVVSH
jgi:hypothetical protein